MTNELSEEQRALLLMSLKQVRNLDDISKTLKEYINNNIDMYDPNDEEMIRILALIDEAVISEVKISSSVASLVYK